MADVYYKIDGDNCYYTNEAKDGYSKRNTGQTAEIAYHNIIIELYNDKFEIPVLCHNLFFRATNTTFNDMDKGVFPSGIRVCSSMFEGCTNLVELNLINFKDTSNIYDTTTMFGNCTNLKTVYVPRSGDLSAVRNDYNMFKNCTSIVGGDGTVYNSNNITSEYGRIDRPGSPGYFTQGNGWKQYVIYEKRRDFGYEVAPYIKLYDEWDENPAEVYLQEV